jgi:hypothetical protein
LNSWQWLGTFYVFGAVIAFGFHWVVWKRPVRALRGAVFWPFSAAALLLMLLLSFFIRLRERTN